MGQYKNPKSLALVVMPGPTFTYQHLEETDGVLISEQLTRAWLAPTARTSRWKPRFFWGGVRRAGDLTVVNRDRDVPLDLRAKDDGWYQLDTDAQESQPLPLMGEVPKSNMPSSTVAAAITDPLDEIPGDAPEEVVQAITKSKKDRVAIPYVATPESEAALRRYAIRDRIMVNERAKPEQSQPTDWMKHALVGSFSIAAVTAGAIGITGVF